MKKKSVFNSFISIGSYQSFIDQIFLMVENKTPSYVCFANVHMLIEAHQDHEFQKVLNEANLVAPDGKPLGYFFRLFRGIRQERVCGMDLLPDILKRAEALNKSVFFYGTTDDLLQTIVHKAHGEFPHLKIAGHYSPPFVNKLCDEELALALHTIKQASPDLVLVALGCPKQEKWMAENKNKIGACLLGLGQAFHVYSGREKRLPLWMRNLSLEWVYRLCHEPRRLWRRYAFTNCYFLLLVLKYFIRNTYLIYFRKPVLRNRLLPISHHRSE